MGKYCCQDLEYFVNDLKGKHLPIGQGEISGGVSLETLNDKKMQLFIDDGWNDFHYLIFNYCPYCGTRQ